MTATGIYVTSEGERELRERCQELLTRWPVPSERLRIPAREGETFIIASDPPAAPPPLLVHGSSTTCVMWLGDVATWAQARRVPATGAEAAPHATSVSASAQAERLPDGHGHQARRPTRGTLRPMSGKPGVYPVPGSCRIRHERP
ncbi:hypothetical protein ACQPZZ_30860 [Microbispora sp. CA-135349]|uniref:hypothetical protein n=1 Tax=Microbispora sp. CA-135349 TaxID=3239953 RepID=UPI003D8AB9B9